MKKCLLGLILVLFFFAETALCLEIGGVELPDTLKGGDSELVLNGAGLRKKFGFKVYAAGVYLKAKSSDNNAIINADEPMILRMQWRRGVPTSKINSVFFDSFATVVKAPEQDDYNEKSDYGPLTKQIVEFMGIVAAEDVTKDYCNTYIYIPGKGTEIHIHNGTASELKSTIPGLDFKKALFSIWLADEPPVGESLRDELLGK